MNVNIVAKVVDDAGLFELPITVPDLTAARRTSEAFCSGVSSVIGRSRYSVSIRERFYSPESRGYVYREVDSFECVA